MVNLTDQIVVEMHLNWKRMRSKGQTVSEVEAWKRPEEYLVAEVAIESLMTTLD